MLAVALHLPMTTDDELCELRRKLIDALLAIHVTTGKVRIDQALAERLERAWDEYDAAVRATPA